MDIASYQEVSAGPFALDGAGWSGSGRARLDPARGTGGDDEAGAPALLRAGALKARLDPARVIHDDMWWQSAHSVGAGGGIAPGPAPQPHEPLADALPRDLAAPLPAGRDPEPERQPRPQASAAPAGWLRRLRWFAFDNAVVRGIHRLRLRRQRPAAPAAPAARDRLRLRQFPGLGGTRAAGKAAEPAAPAGGC